MEPVWRGWKYHRSQDAAKAFERIVKISTPLRVADIGLWKSRSADGRDHFVIMAGAPDTVALVCERFTAKHGEPWNVPDSLRGPLWTRHLSTIAAEFLETGKSEVATRSHHGKGGFLHSDGSLHPFPEPRGQG